MPKTKRAVRIFISSSRSWGNFQGRGNCRWHSKGTCIRPLGTAGTRTFHWHNTGKNWFRSFLRILRAVQLAGTEMANTVLSKVQSLANPS